jgi:hypothetical protein
MLAAAGYVVFVLLLFFMLRAYVRFLDSGG